MTRYQKIVACVLKYTGLLGLLLCLLPGCDKQAPLKIGFVGGLSGRVADLGLSGRNGVLLAIEQYNLRRSKGQPVAELLVEDDRQDPATAQAAVTRLLDQNVSAIIGHMTSAMSVATVPLVNQARTVMLSPTTTTTRLTGKDDYFFRVIDTTRDYASHGARFFYQQQKVRKTVAFYDLQNEAFTISYLDDFRNAFKQSGGAIIASKPFRSGTDISFFQLVEETLLPEADGILIITNALDAALICQQVRKLRPDIPIIISEWSATEKFIGMGGDAVEGVFAHQYFDRDSEDSDYLAFRRAYIARFNEEPGFASVGGYDAATVILEAHTALLPGETLKETLLRVQSFDGIQDKIVFDPYGDTSRKTRLSVVRDGQFVPLD